MNLNFKTALDIVKILSISEKIKLIQEITAQIQSELKKAQPESYKSLRGLWKGLDIDEKEISQARKEMWDNFPRGYMMSNAVTDTHSLIWYLEDSPRLGSEAGRIFESCEKGEITIYIPTICLTEIVYLQEKGRIPAHFIKQLETELFSDDSNFIPADLTVEIVHSISKIPRSLVPDMPDRIIAGTALYLSLPLISRDRKIKLSQIETIW